MILVCMLSEFSLKKASKILYWWGWSEKHFYKNVGDGVLLQRQSRKEGLVLIKS